MSPCHIASFLLCHDLLWLKIVMNDWSTDVLLTQPRTCAVSCHSSRAKAFKQTLQCPPELVEFDLKGSLETEVGLLELILSD